MSGSGVGRRQVVARGVDVLPGGWLLAFAYEYEYEYEYETPRSICRSYSYAYPELPVLSL